MFFEQFVSQDLSFQVYISREDELRIIAHRFETKGLNKAGHFCAWTSLKELFFDPVVNREFFEQLRDDWSMKELGSSDIEIDCGRVIGWGFTDNLDKYNPDDLEYFQPNKKSSGLRVKLDKVHILAPKTEKVNIVYNLREDRSVPDRIRAVVKIYTIYPGENIGEVRNNISRREGIIFFDLDHPGEAIL